MSMLSAQVDRLRELAARCDELQVGAVGAVRVPLDMGSILREAADTIWELRNKCADLVDEQERLFRANVEKNNKILRLVGENARLRELAVLNWEWVHSCCGNSCKVQTEGCGYGIDRECNYEREIWDRMRELGVEVDG